MRAVAFVLAAVLAMALPYPPRAWSESKPTDSTVKLIQTIKAVGKEGAGSPQAAAAWKTLVQQGPGVLMTILASLDQNEPLSANWLRSAADAIAEEALAQKKPLPAKELDAFVRDTQRDPRARRVAYEWLVRIDPQAPARLLPGMLQDPSIDLRRDAVAVVLDAAKKLQDQGEKEPAIAAYRKALEGARDRDQVDAIAKQMKALGVEIDLAAHFGFIRRWQLIGPFDSTKGVGFARTYPPEKSVDLAATYDGKKGPVRWVEHTTADPYGVVDLNKALGKNMGAAAYAFAEFQCPVGRAVEIRAGSNNAVKIFLNGKELLAHEEYHHGQRMDQYVARATLRTGRNELLIKVCQNEQTEDWAQSWSFQVRICDAVGTAVPLAVAATNPGPAPTDKKE
jgi:hypothetical protein